MRFCRLTLVTSLLSQFEVYDHLNLFQVKSKINSCHVSVDHTMFVAFGNYFMLLVYLNYKYVYIYIFMVPAN